MKKESKCLRSEVTAVKVESECPESKGESLWELVTALKVDSECFESWWMLWE